MRAWLVLLLPALASAAAAAAATTTCREPALDLYSTAPSCGHDAESVPLACTAPPLPAVPPRLVLGPPAQQVHQLLLPDPPGCACTLPPTATLSIELPGLALPRADVGGAGTPPLLVLLRRGALALPVARLPALAPRALGDAPGAGAWGLAVSRARTQRRVLGLPPSPGFDDVAAAVVTGQQPRAWHHSPLGDGAWRVALRAATGGGGGGGGDYGVNLAAGRPAAASYARYGTDAGALTDGHVAGGVGAGLVVASGHAGHPCARAAAAPAAALSTAWVEVDLGAPRPVSAVRLWGGGGRGAHAGGVDAWRADVQHVRVVLLSAAAAAEGPNATRGAPLAHADDDAEDSRPPLFGASAASLRLQVAFRRGASAVVTTAPLSPFAPASVADEFACPPDERTRASSRRALQCGTGASVEAALHAVLRPLGYVVAVTSRGGGGGGGSSSGTATAAPPPPLRRRTAQAGHWHVTISTVVGHAAGVPLLRAVDLVQPPPPPLPPPGGGQWGFAVEVTRLQAGCGPAWLSDGGVPVPVLPVVRPSCTAAAEAATGGGDAAATGGGGALTAACPRVALGDAPTWLLLSNASLGDAPTVEGSGALLSPAASQSSLGVAFSRLLAGRARACDSEGGPSLTVRTWVPRAPPHQRLLALRRRVSAALAALVPSSAAVVNVTEQPSPPLPPAVATWAPVVARYVRVQRASGSDEAPLVLAEVEVFGGGEAPLLLPADDETGGGAVERPADDAAGSAAGGPLRLAGRGVSLTVAPAQLWQLCGCDGGTGSSEDVEAADVGGSELGQPGVASTLLRQRTAPPLLLEVRPDALVP